MAEVHDMLRCQCPKCKAGIMVEEDLWKDWDGNVTCNKCMYGTRRWCWEDKKGHAPD